ncbi:MAG TPA: c-type cytochrome [Terriglobales bacterium]|nr:c-type cytochrome [Terriglobales bacterium]
MKIPRQIAIWGSAAVLSLVVLFFIVVGQNREAQRRWAVQVTAKPVAGSVVFRNKGCATCHGATANGTVSGPGLRQRESPPGLPQLVTAMWNHAPRMWQAMESRHLPYPTLSYEETSQLVSYLYVSGYLDNGGDSERGEKLFQARKCGQCHRDSSDGEDRARPLNAMAEANDPLLWTQALWNHASVMQAKMQSMGIAWPKFQASDLRDLFAYVRHMSQSPEDDPPDLAGDPDRGWALFQQKGCIRCHAVSAGPGRIGPSLGAERELPPTFSEFGAALLNHFPEMQNAMQAEKTGVPRFEDHDMMDVAVFLYSLHYLEPTGSPQIGKSIFSWRGCSRCHGENAEGTNEGPALRGRAKTYTAVRLATNLWAHGERMYQNSQKDGQPWPTLQDSDIGHLLTFLNTSPDR